MQCMNAKDCCANCAANDRCQKSRERCSPCDAVHLQMRKLLMLLITSTATARARRISAATLTTAAAATAAAASSVTTVSTTAIATAVTTTTTESSLAIAAIALHLMEAIVSIGSSSGGNLMCLGMVIGPRLRVGGWSRCGSRSSLCLTGLSLHFHPLL